MIYSIRPIAQADAADWLRLRNLLWEGDDHPAEIAQFFQGELDEPAEVLVATDENAAVVAHVELSLRDDIAGMEGVKTGYIEGLYVDERHRASGLTLQLLRASEQWARAQGCQAFASDRDDRIIVHAKYQAEAV